MIFCTVMVLVRDGVSDGESLINKAAQAGCLSADLVVAQDMVRQQIVHELLIVLSDEDGSVTTAKEIAAAHALDMSVGHALVRDQFVHHLLTYSCIIIKGSLGGRGRVCVAIARGFSEVLSLVNYMPDTVSSLRAKKLTKPLVKNILGILDVDVVPGHARRSEMICLRDLSRERLVDFVSSHDIEVDCGLYRDGSRVSGRVSMWDVFAYAMKVCCYHRIYEQINEIYTVGPQMSTCNHCDVYCAFIHWILRQANITTKLQFRSNRVPTKGKR
ncbi:hypothetical protein EDB19DRAFT_653128 [Suillus lakei]|nr:hypothetical protein EDB19DRAFT_653128 [Suillus lakei]